MKSDTVIAAVMGASNEGRENLAREAARQLKVRALEEAEALLVEELKELGTPILQGLERADWTFAETERVRILLGCLEQALGSGFAARRHLIEKGMTIA